MKPAAPIRRCVGCGERDRQQDLIRFTQDTEGQLHSGGGLGRGAYLHPRHTCLNAFTRARSKFVRSLKKTVSRESRESYAILIENSLRL
jgi:predicted RNA-binding protein YlxR (DUF448 family)